MFNEKKHTSMSEAAAASVQAEEMPNNGTQEMTDEDLSVVAGGVNPFANSERVPLQKYDEQKRKIL